MDNNQRVWFVTGSNKGIGAAIVKEALEQVVAAARQAMAKRLVNVVNCDHAPVRLLINKGVIPIIDAHYKARYAEFEKWQGVSADSDFDQ